MIFYFFAPRELDVDSKAKTWYVKGVAFSKPLACRCLCQISRVYQVTCWTLKVWVFVLFPDGFRGDANGFSRSGRYTYLYNNHFKTTYPPLLSQLSAYIYTCSSKLLAQKTPQQKPIKMIPAFMHSFSSISGLGNRELQGALNDHHHSVLHVPWSQHHQIGGCSCSQQTPWKFWSDSEAVFCCLIFLELVGGIPEKNYVAKGKGRDCVTIFGKHHQTINNIAY